MHFRHRQTDRQTDTDIDVKLCEKFWCQKLLITNHLLLFASCNLLPFSCAYVFLSYLLFL